jgi:hypothetical protein
MMELGWRDKRTCNSYGIDDTIDDTSFFRLFLLSLVENSALWVTLAGQFYWRWNCPV